MKSTNPIFTHKTLQLLPKCTSLPVLKQLHSHMIAVGLTLHTYPLSKLLFSSSEINVPYTLSIFHQIPNPTTFLYNTLISCLITHNNHHQHTHIAFSLYNKLLSNQLTPNSFTYPSLFKACGAYPCSDHGRVLHAHALKFLGDGLDQFVQASLLNYYASRGELSAARYLFDRIEQPDLAVWNSMLCAYSNADNSNNNNNNNNNVSLEALSIFCNMLMSYVRPNEVTLVAVISACAKLGALSQGIWAHAYIIRNKLKLNRFVSTALIEMYSKCGSLHLATQVFDKMFQRDTFCYNAMIGGLAIHGCGHKALALYEEMGTVDLIPDNVTFIVVISACSHVGLVDEGCKVFESIKGVYDMEPMVEHYGCLVDLLSRAGRFVEAEERMREMPMKPNAVLWRSLLAAARIHGNLEAGEVAVKHLVELEPETSGNYVLLSNIYAKMNQWEDVKRMRRLMKHQGIVKTPGSSLLEINGAIHEFLTGDKTHPRWNEISSKLEEINTRLREHGHSLRTKEVLFDIEEEEKEGALSYHSERLAIAYALVVAGDFCSSGPIRIVKNLRFCSDCHESTKLVSAIYGREIIVRDRSRFHHFKDGSCSCSDYW